MTRRVVYGVGLWITVATIVITLIAVIKPLWITHTVRTDSGHTETYKYGLNKFCDPVSGTCRHFLQSADCRADHGFLSALGDLVVDAAFTPSLFYTSSETVSGSGSMSPQRVGGSGSTSARRFCSLWRSAAFMMNFSVVLLLAVLVAFAVTILGGKQKRDRGWRVICGILGVVFAVQCASMAIVAFLYDHDKRFEVGWKLDTSWILTTVSWVLLLFTGSGLMACGILLPEEGGYELIPPP